MSNKAIITSDVKTLVKNNIRNYSMFIVLVFIMLIFAYLTNGVNFNPRNLPIFSFRTAMY